MESTNIYPQLPVISQDGEYKIKNDEDQTIEKGKAKRQFTCIQPQNPKQKRHGGTALKLKLKLFVWMFFVRWSGCVPRGEMERKT